MGALLAYSKGTAQYERPIHSPSRPEQPKWLLRPATWRPRRLHADPATPDAAAVVFGRTARVAVGCRPRHRTIGRLDSDPAQPGSVRPDVREKGSRSFEPDRGDAELSPGLARGRSGSPRARCAPGRR